MTVSEFKIDGTAYACPAHEGITVSDELMWSANAGRLATTGEMAGTIVAVKKKYKIKWPALTVAEARALRNVIINKSTPFHTLELLVLGGSTETHKVYFSSPSYELYNWSEGLRYVTGFAVDAIEQ